MNKGKLSKLPFDRLVPEMVCVFVSSKRGSVLDILGDVQGWILKRKQRCSQTSVKRGSRSEMRVSGKSWYRISLSANRTTVSAAEIVRVPTWPIPRGRHAI